MADISTVSVTEGNNTNTYNLVDEDFYNMIADQYSNMNTYEVGDFCIYECELYKCITAITSPENFVFTKWQKIMIQDLIGGES